jgi:magnesium chelatase subunit I
MSSSLCYPFTAIVKQDEMRLSLQLASIDPSLGGVLILGDRGTGKSTAVRGLANILPAIKVVKGCLFNCEPGNSIKICKICNPENSDLDKKNNKIIVQSRTVPVVDLPLGSTEDRIVGSLDMQKALTKGLKELDPGLLANAHRGFLYIDEVNLLEDHLVDLLIDVSASGKNLIEREGLSLSHPAKFVLIGSGNPEEGDLRPQLLDRFGFSVEVSTPTDLKSRVEVIKRRQKYDADPKAFLESWKKYENDLSKKIKVAQNRLIKIETPDFILEKIAELCIFLKTDGLRGELTLSKASRALASLGRSKIVKIEHVKQVSTMCLRHRLRRDPLDDTSSNFRVERAIEEVFKL